MRSRQLPRARGRMRSTIELHIDSTAERGRRWKEHRKARTLDGFRAVYLQSDPCRKGPNERGGAAVVVLEAAVCDCSGGSVMVNGGITMVNEGMWGEVGRTIKGFGRSTSADGRGSTAFYRYYISSMHM